MEVVPTTNYELIAHLNKDVQDFHVGLAPEHFKAYDNETVIQFFERIIADENFRFYVLQDGIIDLGYV